MDERRVVDVSNDDLGGADVPDIKFLSSGAIRDSADHVSAWNTMTLVGSPHHDIHYKHEQVTGVNFMLYHSIRVYITPQWHQIVDVRALEVV